VFANISATGTSDLMSLQAPTTLQGITSDPPEDITILRIIGDFLVLITGAPATWILALVVQDTTWTPTATFPGDADKRILWSQTYFCSGTNESYQWYSGIFVPNGTPAAAAGTPREMSHIDISPKVRLEPGKGLFLVAYEQNGAVNFSVDPGNVRMLFQRTSRRR